MGVSATGERGIRPRTVRLLFYVVMAALLTLIYLVAPVVVPGLHQAAEDRCNVLNGSDFRSYRVEWVVPQPPGTARTGCARTRVTWTSPA